MQQGCDHGNENVNSKCLEILSQDQCSLQTANLRHFVCYKNKTIDSEIFLLYNLFRKPKTLYRHSLTV